MPKPLTHLRQPQGSTAYRVLLIDDDRETIEGLERLLTLNGFDVQSTDDKAALATAREFRPHAIVLDIGLPTIDGCQLATELRAQPETADALVVAVTGFSQEQDSIRSRAAGVDHHLIKPIEPAALVQLLRANERVA
jgi:DNA-binding response OmpR family regulator